VVEADDFTADYLFSRSVSTHKTPAEVNILEGKE